MPKLSLCLCVSACVSRWKRRGSLVFPLHFWMVASSLPLPSARRPPASNLNIRSCLLLPFLFLWCYYFIFPFSSYTFNTFFIKHKNAKHKTQNTILYEITKLLPKLKSYLRPCSFFEFSLNNPFSSFLSSFWMREKKWHFRVVYQEKKNFLYVGIFHEKKKQ